MRLKNTYIQSWYRLRFGFTENRKYFDAQSKEYQDWCDCYAACAVNLVRIELVRIVTFATSHQQETNANDYQPCNDPDIVFLSEKPVIGVANRLFIVHF